MSSASVIAIGSRVTVTDTARNREQSFLLVEGAGDPGQGAVSTQSPVGRALAGRHVGELVAVAAPSGTRQLRIVALA